MLAAAEDDRFMANVTADMHPSEAARNRAVGGGSEVETLYGPGA